MSFIEDILERDMDWYSGLEKREDGDDDGDGEDDDDDDDDEHKSSTSTSQTQTSTSSSITSTSSMESTTSSSPSTQSSPTSGIPTTSKTVKTTFLTSAFTKPASLSATQKGKGNASTTSSSTKSSSTSLTTTQGISSGPNTNANTPSKTAINIAIGLSVLGILLIALLLFIFRRKKSSASNTARSTLDKRSSFTETAPNAPQAIYIPPTMRQNNPLSPLARNPHISDENSLENKKPKFRITRKPVAVQDMRRGKEEGIGLARGSGVMDEKHRVKSEANAGVWEDPVTVARRQSVRESVMSWPRWKSPVSWVRDQNTRGWGRLSG